MTARNLFTKFLNVVWAAVLISLPFTSFPLFESKFGIVVSPLAAAPLILMLAAWLLPYILRRGQLPRECLPVFVFCLAALAASLLAFFIDIPTFKGASVTGQELRAFLTLGLGISFYLVFSSFPRENKDIDTTLKWISLGGALLILWTLTQAYFMFFNSEKFPAWYVQFQSLFSSKTAGLKWVVSRVTGLAYESSWFSHQLMILYFPVWFAETVQRRSSFRLRIFHLSVENILLAVGFFEFFLSSPRISLVGMLIVVVYFFGKVNFRLHRRIMDWLGARWHAFKAGSRWARGGIGAGIALVMILFYVSAAFLGIYAIGQRDSRIGLIFKNPPTIQEVKGLLTLDQTTLIDMGFRLAFGERIIYWLTGFNIFNSYPLTGIGLGNSGFFFLQQMPVQGYSSPEIRSLMNESAGLPNIKSLWFRLLSETGLVGFSIFVAWLVLLWRSASNLTRSNQAGVRLIGLAGQFALLAFIAEGFSVDSFAMPYLWVTTGMVSAAGLMYRKELANA